MVAWRESRVRLEELRREQMRIENQLALATQARNSACEQITRARQALLSQKLLCHADTKDRVKLTEAVWIWGNSSSNDSSCLGTKRRWRKISRMSISV